MGWGESDRSDDKKFVRWAKQVKSRDNFCCQVCSKEGVYLESHHLWSWSAYPEKRYDIENGICLCQKCHQHFHAIFGTNCTEYDFNQFVEIYKTFEAIIKASLK
jgi:5-methylcytosine-specific restriction endonuclease McrA